MCPRGRPMVDTKEMLMYNLNAWAQSVPTLLDWDMHLKDVFYRIV